MLHLSRLIVLIFCFLFAFPFVGEILSMYADDDKDKLYYHDTDTTIWFAQAWAGAYVWEDGWYTTWCHVGTGDNDHKGGTYQGGFSAYSSSASVSVDEPTPYWSSSFITGSCIHCRGEGCDVCDATPHCDLCTSSCSGCGTSSQ